MYIHIYVLPSGRGVLPPPPVFLVQKEHSYSPTLQSSLLSSWSKVGLWYSGAYSLCTCGPLVHWGLFFRYLWAFGTLGPILYICTCGPLVHWGLFFIYLWAFGTLGPILYVRTCGPLVHWVLFFMYVPVGLWYTGAYSLCTCGPLVDRLVFIYLWEIVQLRPSLSQGVRCLCETRILLCTEIIRWNSPSLWNFPSFWNFPSYSNFPLCWGHIFGRSHGWHDPQTGV